MKQLLLLLCLRSYNWFDITKVFFIFLQLVISTFSLTVQCVCTVLPIVRYSRPLCCITLPLLFLWTSKQSYFHVHDLALFVGNPVYYPNNYHPSSVTLFQIYSIYCFYSLSTVYISHLYRIQAFKKSFLISVFAEG